MNILVSGASGSFGSELCNCLDEFTKISVRIGRINERMKIELSNCDVFVHFGALLHGYFANLFDSNVLTTKNILDYLSLT